MSFLREYKEYYGTYRYTGMFKDGEVWLVSNTSMPLHLPLHPVYKKYYEENKKIEFVMHKYDDDTYAVPVVNEILIDYEKFYDERA